MPRHYITFRDLSLEDYGLLFQRSFALKEERRKGVYLRNHLKGRPVAVLFSKNSTRTRVSFECAVNELGGHAIILNLGDSQWARGEPLSHSARVFSGYVSAIVIRHGPENDLVKLSESASVPVVNALTDERHPCQVAADVFTILEKGRKIPLEKQKVCWIGDGGNMCQTWLEAAAVLGFALNVSCPEGYQPDPSISKRAMADNPEVRFLQDPLEAARGATVVTTDVFTSMGREKEAERRRKDFQGFQVNAKLMAAAAEDAIFLHCLPAHPGEEVTEEVFERHADSVFAEAENRLHVQKALLELLIPGLP
ncbi:MAG: ornithine carbamoyltransferase [Deltaproteobacteria bacterium]|jgi:ornithine carbamoyltransferase|nr:ornithine carbamoyltransferase [Deltaproteobacteria bacterium]